MMKYIGAVQHAYIPEGDFFQRLAVLAVTCGYNKAYYSSIHMGVAGGQLDSSGTYAYRYNNFYLAAKKNQGLLTLGQKK